VTPPPTITNRRTGYVQHFGPRRAFDGAYALEVLAASGCWHEDIDKVLWVLEPLTQHNCEWLTVEHLFKLLQCFGEQCTPEEFEQIRRAGDGASGQKINGVLTIAPGKPRLTVVENTPDA
jgi:hypothetical protein